MTIMFEQKWYSYQILKKGKVGNNLQRKKKCQKQFHNAKIQNII